MRTHKNTLGKTEISVSLPWGLNYRNGHKVLCGDGKIRALNLAQTADTFFSTPASVRIKGKHVTGYMTVSACYCTESKRERRAFTFQPHTESNLQAGNPLPAFPESFTPELFDMLACGEEKQF